MHASLHIHAATPFQSHPWSAGSAASWHSPLLTPTIVAGRGETQKLITVTALPRMRPETALKRTRAKAPTAAKVMKGCFVSTPGRQSLPGLARSAFLRSNSSCCTSQKMPRPCQPLLLLLACTMM
eukprot:2704452-Rhodomonas_salina.2